MACQYEYEAGSAHCPNYILNSNMQNNIEFNNLTSRCTHSKISCFVRKVSSCEKDIKKKGINPQI